MTEPENNIAQPRTEYRSELITTLGGAIIEPAGIVRVSYSPLRDAYCGNELPLEECEESQLMIERALGRQPQAEAREELARNGQRVRAADVLSADTWRSHDKDNFRCDACGLLCSVALGMKDGKRTEEVKIAYLQKIDSGKAAATPVVQEELQ